MQLTYEHILRGTIACGKCGNNLHRNGNGTLQCLNSKCEHWRITFAEPRIALTVVVAEPKSERIATIVSPDKNAVGAL